MSEGTGLLAVGAQFPSMPDVPTVLRPIPELAPESVVDHVSAGADSGDRLVKVSGDRITVLHSYRHAGWRHAVREQWLRTGAVERLRSVALELPPGFGLAVFDAWRPLALQRELFDAISGRGDVVTDSAKFVAPPCDDPAWPPPHLTGGAIDVTLTWHGAALALGSGFDEFTDLTATRAFESSPGPVRALRRLLYHGLRAQGFVVLAEEWWHFEYGTRLWSALTGEPTCYGPASPGQR
jgi:D-alanyl-D-alanine dipeptidase